MNFSDLPRDPARAYAHPSMQGVRLVFRSNVDEPVLVTLDDFGTVVGERPDPDLGASLRDGWEAAEPLPATGIVRDDATYRDPADQPPGAP